MNIQFHGQSGWESLGNHFCPSDSVGSALNPEILVLYPDQNKFHWPETKAVFLQPKSDGVLSQETQGVKRIEPICQGITCDQGITCNANCL